METIRGPLQKMKVQAEAPVVYHLLVGPHEVPLNACLSQTLHLLWSGAIFCIACGRQTKRSFQHGYCYPCFKRLACCDLCIVKPELCHYAQGTCREPAWGVAHCLQPHYVYLANTTGVKVGITRARQLPVRWLDQGAVQALPVFRVPSRYQAGVLEVALKQYVTDRTDWRRMLQGEPNLQNLQDRRDELLSRCADDLTAAVPSANEPAAIFLEEAEPQTFTYPHSALSAASVRARFPQNPSYRRHPRGHQRTVPAAGYRRAQHPQICGLRGDRHRSFTLLVRSL